MRLSPNSATLAVFSPFSATVAVFCDSRRFRPQSHFSATGGQGFSGCYLLGVDDYRVVGGSRRWGTSCTYDFFSTDDVASGRFFSEKFPQNYPASLSCSYLFVASADQVITVTFSSLRLASGHHQHLQHLQHQQQQEQQDADDSRSV